MSTDRIKSLDMAIREALKPELLERGFTYEAGSRTFRKEVGECTQIVNIQVGVSSMEGQFTVNLGVFHPTYRYGADKMPPPAKPKEFDCFERERLAMLRATFLSRLVRPGIGKPDRFFKWWLRTPSDKWWPFTSDTNENVRQLVSLKALLLGSGIDWLNAKSDVNALRTKYEQLGQEQSGG